VLPKVRSLSRGDKLRLIQLVAQELADGEEACPIQPDRSYPVWSPERAFDAAAVMLQVLDAEKGHS
jgi:hypothetical protein